MSPSTQLSNRTKHGMKVLVGSGRHASELATVEAGGNYVIDVHYNATYREYNVGIDAPGMENFSIVVSTDDLCDNKCITVMEDSDCKLKVQKEPRVSGTATTEAPTKSEKSTAGYVHGCRSRLAIFTCSTVSRREFASATTTILVS